MLFYLQSSLPASNKRDLIVQAGLSEIFLSLCNEKQKHHFVFDFSPLKSGARKSK